MHLRPEYFPNVHFARYGLLVCKISLCILEKLHLNGENTIFTLLRAATKTQIVRAPIFPAIFDLNPRNDVSFSTAMTGNWSYRKKSECRALYQHDLTEL